MGDRQKKKRKKKRYPGCLAHVVSGMFHSVIANRRQPNSNLSAIVGGVGGGAGGGGYSFVACFCRFTIGHASLSRRSIERGGPCGPCPLCVCFFYVFFHGCVQSRDGCIAKVHARSYCSKKAGGQPSRQRVWSSNHCDCASLLTALSRP